jgi:hypothetical protein
MNKHLIAVFVLFTVILSASAQKQTYFSTVPLDSIKVQSLKGIYVGTSFNPVFTNKLDKNDQSYQIPLTVGFFMEKRIASSWTLTSRIDLTYAFGKQAQRKIVIDSIRLENSNYYTYSSINSVIDSYSSYRNINLEISVEPRWYINYKRRFINGNANLNSGLYVSLPISTNFNLYNSYRYPVSTSQYSQYYYPTKQIVTIMLSPTIGYRQAISKRLFLEGNLRLTDCYLDLYSEQSKLNLLVIPPFNNIIPELNFKLAYTFK